MFVGASLLSYGLVVAPVHAHAASLGLDFQAGASDYGISGWNLGWSFTANSNVAVVGLGNWAAPVSFPQDQQVGLWNSNGTLIASAYVTNADPLVGTAPWRFASIAPVQLTAGQTYVVGGQGGADYTVISGPTVNPLITYITSLYTYNSGANSPLVEPLSPQSSPYGWFGGNIELTSTPLPSTWTMLIAGFVGFSFLGYRGSKKRNALLAG